MARLIVFHRNRGAGPARAVCHRANDLPATEACGDLMAAREGGLFDRQAAWLISLS